MHGGRAGRPVEHCLYSRRVPADWLDTYDYFKTDPEYLALRSEIALAQTNMSRFLSDIRDQTFSARDEERLMTHLEHISKLKERENKRVYHEQVVNAALRAQMEIEVKALLDILVRRFDVETAEQVCAEWTEAIRAAGGPELTVAL
jgi:hypothetical protein